LNLMANAADAMDRILPELRKLVIRSSVNADGKITVAVTDVGLGVDTDNLGRVFDPFFTTKSGSLGMGLAICKTMVESHGGRIEADSQAGRGTTFRFALPLAREETP
jgi:signal transduction histidine kinase